MATLPRSSTTTLIAALEVLARDIQSEDGVANAAIAEAARRLGELQLLVFVAWPLVQDRHLHEHSFDHLPGERKKRPIDALYAQMKAEVGAC